MTVTTQVKPTELVTRVLEEGGVFSARYLALKTGLAAETVKATLEGLKAQGKVKHPRGALVVGSRKNYWELTESE